MSMFMKIHLLHCHVGEFAEELPVQSDGPREQFHQVMARFKPLEMYEQTSSISIQ